MKKLILCDLDKTLIDANYRANSRVLGKFLRNLQTDDFLVGLNSDTPLLSLKKFANEWGLNGPIIAELGGALSFETKELFFRDKNFWSSLRARIIEFLNRNMPECLVCVGNSLGFIKDIMAINYSPGKVAIVNGLRQVSFSCYFRGIRKNKLVKSQETSQQISQLILQEAGTEYQNFFVDINEEYGILIIHNKGAKKSVALPTIRELFTDYQIFMIGDSLSDYLDERVIHCAVGNGKKEYKDKCKIIAPIDKTYTQGVIYLLKTINEY